MTRRLLETKEVDQRVRQHGGILEAIQWGIRSDAIADPELATLWRGIEDRYDDLRDRLVVASRMLVTGRAA